MGTLSRRYIAALQQLDAFAAIACQDNDAAHHVVTGTRVSAFMTDDEDTDGLLIVTPAGAMPKVVRANRYFRLQLIEQVQRDALALDVNPSMHYQALFTRLRDRYSLN